MNKQLSRVLSSAWIYVIALLLGFINALAFDIPFDSSLTFFGPVLNLSALLGFLFFLTHLSAKRSLFFGYCFGLGLFGWGLNWVYISMANYGNAPLAFAILANAGVVAYLSLYWLLGAYLIAKLGKTPTQRLLLAAPIIALLEWVRSVFLIGFPWLSIGYAWIDTPLAQLSSFGGVFFISFVIVLLLSSLLLPIRRLHKYLLLLKLSVLVAIFCFPFFPNKAGNSTTVALVQGNMPVITDYNEKRMTENLVQYFKLTQKAIAQSNHANIDTVIWAEAAIPYFYEEIPDFLTKIQRYQKTTGFDFISGAPLGSWASGQIYNGIFLQSKDTDNPTTFYRKQHLLPFGEYLPFRSIFSFFSDFVDIPMADFARGNLVQKPFISNGLSFSPSICFEAVFGNEIRQNAQNTDVLLNISNDAWFGRSKAQPQHLNIARMRAVENQKYLIRATNNGITAVIAPSGSVEKSLPPFTEDVLTATVTARDKTTLYARFGDIPWLVLFVLFAGVILVISRFPKAA